MLMLPKLLLDEAKAMEIDELIHHPPRKFLY